MSNGNPLDIWYFPVLLVAAIYLPWFTQWIDTKFFFSKRSMWCGNVVYRVIASDLEIELWIHRYSGYRPYFELHVKFKD